MESDRVGSVLIGNKVVSEQVTAEIDCALTAHELFNVPAQGLGHESRETAFEEIADMTGAQAVLHIGEVLVFFRKKHDE